MIVKKGTNTLIFYIFQYGAKCSAECGARQYFIISGILQKQSLKVFYKKSYSEKFLKINRKETCTNVSFLIKLLKKRLWNRCFLMNFEKFLRTPFSQNTSRRLLLIFMKTKVDSLYFQRHNFLNVRPRFGRLRSCFSIILKLS